MKVEDLKSEVELWLEDYFKNKGGYNKLIYEAMYYSLKVGGKRIRPILMLLVYDLFKKDYKKILPLASALEMIHTYSLIHDDLPCMDNDDLRRGKPTNHKIYGEAVAVLAGDALLNEAFSIMFRYCSFGNNNAIKACNLIADSSGAEGMIGGQIVDILSEGEKITKDELHYMHKHKTGSLIVASIVSAAILAEAEEGEINLLREYGEKLGLAFQIVDDILDITGDVNTLGKNVNSDAFNDKSTFVTIYGLDYCIKKSEELTKECILALKQLNKDTSVLEELTLFLLKRQF